MDCQGSTPLAAWEPMVMQQQCDLPVANACGHIGVCAFLKGVGEAPIIQLNMNSTGKLTEGTLLLNEGNSLKERTILGHPFAFDRLRRTHSMPKRPLSEKSKTPAVPVAENRSPLPSKTAECFHGFNRAKSRFFHSCRIPSRSKQSPDSQQSHDNPTWSHLIRLGKNPHGSISTIVTCISVDEEDGHMRVDDSRCTHPALKDHEGDLPAPTPPPRAVPRSKPADFSESSQLHTCSSPIDMPSLGTSVDSQSSSYLNPFGDEDHCDDVRIYPVVQNGVKMSDTHYWIINPPRSSSKRWHQNRSECSDSARVALRGTLIDASRDRLFNGRPTSFSAKLFKDHQLQYENIPSSFSACSSPVSKPDENCTKTTMLRRGKSESSKEFLQTAQRNLVQKLRLLVPSATPEECRAVLIGSSWDFERAQRRLKLELLCRTGCASKSACERLLQQTGWDLTEALAQSRLEASCRRGVVPRRPDFIFEPAAPSIRVHSPAEISPSSSSMGEPPQLTPDCSPVAAFPCDNSLF